MSEKRNNMSALLLMQTLSFRYDEADHYDCA